jgi:4-hydroxybenzoate polyprenyltransferase
LTDRAQVDVSLLPLHQEFLTFLQEEHRRGRNLVLVTAADRKWAERVARQVGLFSEVMASDGKLNLKGQNKSDLLRQRFGKGGFAYAGNEASDTAVWIQAGAAFLVNAPGRLVDRTRKFVPVERVFDDRRNPVWVFLNAVRAKQWVKNLLVFVPLLTSHHLGDLLPLLACALAFLAFSSVASSVYVVNDLCDLHNDRCHPSKKARAFAAGDLSIKSGILLIPLLLLAAVGVSLFLPAEFLLVLGAYYVLNLGYSLYLKQVMILDVLMLAVFYAMRISAGGVAGGIPISHWLLIFSVFIFLSLASGKRVSELHALRRENHQNSVGRGYLSGDLEQLASQGTASGYIAVLVLSLYIYSPEVTVLYESPQLLWLICPLLLYWISRFWLWVHRGQVQEDPIVFVMRDRVSFLVGLLTLLVMLFAKG